MIVKSRTSKHYNFEKPYIEICEGINGQLPVGKDLVTTNNAKIIRNSIGTVFNKQGFLQNIPANYPRFDYDPITHEYKGLLIEYYSKNQTGHSNAIADPYAYQYATGQIVNRRCNTIRKCRTSQTSNRNKYIKYWWLKMCILKCNTCC